MSLIVSQGSGATVSTAVIGGEHFGYNKIVDANVSSGTVGWAIGADGSGQMALRGNITLTDSKGYIGLTTSTIGNVVNSIATIVDSKGFIGLTTSVVGNVINSIATMTGLPAFNSSPSVQAFGQFYSAPQSIASGGLGPLLLDQFGRVQAVITADPKGFIGLVTVAGTLGNSGNVTLNPSSNYIGLATVDIGTNNKVAVAGNVTLSDPKTFIGSVSVGGIVDSKGYIGLTTVTPGTAWPDPKTYIGLVTITGALSAAAGNVTLDAGSKTGIVGNVTLSDSKGFIGLVTLGGGTAWTDPKTYIGLVTITGALSAAAGNVTLDPGSKTGIVGNVTITDSKGYIGLVTATLGSMATVTLGTKLDQVNDAISTGIFYSLLSQVSLASGGMGPLLTDQYGKLVLGDPKTYIGLVTITGALSAAAGNVTLDPGSKTGIVGNVTLSDPKTFIGSVSVGGIVDSKGFIGLVTTQAADPKGFIGLTTIGGGVVGISGNVTLSDPKTFIGSVSVGGLVDSKGFIGLVTAISLNAGTTKTLFTLPFTLSTASQATIVVPTNAGVIYVTQALLSSDATVRVSFKSGVTYLTGNASLGINLNAGGGFVQSGSPDSPVFIGCPSGAFMLEKFDRTGTIANIGGNITYYTQ